MFVYSARIPYLLSRNIQWMLKLIRENYSLIPGREANESHTDNYTLPTHDRFPRSLRVYYACANLFAVVVLKDNDIIAALISLYFQGPSNSFEKFGKQPYHHFNVYHSILALCMIFLHSFLFP